MIIIDGTPSSIIADSVAISKNVDQTILVVAYKNTKLEEAKRLINFLRAFLPIPSDAIPKDSVLREFIGGSCYHD